MYSGITSGRVLDGELLYTKSLEVNLHQLTSRIFVYVDYSVVSKRNHLAQKRSMRLHKVQIKFIKLSFFFVITSSQIAQSSSV